MFPHVSWWYGLLFNFLSVSEDGEGEALKRQKENEFIDHCIY